LVSSKQKQTSKDNKKKQQKQKTKNQKMTTYIRCIIGGLVVKQQQ
jgi:hypothetical protein